MSADEIIEVAIRAAREAGREAARRLDGPREIRVKGLRDLVTDADLAAQEIVLGHIGRHFPDHAIVSEEGTAPIGSGDITWVIDPIDGTSNYAHRFPCFSVSIGVQDREGHLAGVVYDPLREHLFVAERGRGARLDDAPLGVSSVDDPMDALVGLDFARDQGIRRSVLETMARFGPRVHSFRSVGSAALGLCYVAAGWTDAYFHGCLAPWDVAAGILIVREAGGHVTALDGTPWSPGEPSCLASNGRVHAALANLVAG